MQPNEIARIMLDLVPQWYEADVGPQSHRIAQEDVSVEFCSHRKLTPDLETFLTNMRLKLRGFIERYKDATDIASECIQEELVLDWLEIQQSEDHPVDWKRVINYCRFLNERTYENSPVSKNIIISTREGESALDDDCIAKFLDPLAASPHTFLECDSKLRLVVYAEVQWDEITEPITYSLHPSFLHPIHCRLNSDDSNSYRFSLHVTSNRDVVIMDKGGMLATCRKGRWRIYDKLTFKNSLVDIFGNYYVGANLYEPIFDLSYKRHGALLIYDPSHLVLPHVVNQESIIANASRTRQEVLSTARSLGIGEKLGGSYGLRKMVSELASIDGALIFDKDNILAVGAVIESHPETAGSIGARTTAARSAYRWGAKPIKISADGDVEIFFESRNGDQSCDATMTFA
ncbi:MAG TPA: hypothetical protein DDW52_17720 [Planctomycetaceae bacterium]|nr:hypothetical protein [Planctomycetaceae bacterium]